MDPVLDWKASIIATDMVSKLQHEGSARRLLHHHFSMFWEIATAQRWFTLMQGDRAAGGEAESAQGGLQPSAIQHPILSALLEPISHCALQVLCLLLEVSNPANVQADVLEDPRHSTLSFLFEGDSPPSGGLQLCFPDRTSGWRFFLVRNVLIVPHVIRFMTAPR